MGNHYHHLTTYYFSGTGNARNVANWMCDKANNCGIQAESIDIGKSERRGIAPSDKDTLIAFVSPIHGFNYPVIMLRFIIHFPKGKNDVVLMNTRAGMLIGKWVTPGLTGIAFYLAALILWLKGYKIKGFLPVDLPSNWISVHPGLNQKTIEYLHQTNEIKVTRFAQTVLNGGRYYKCLRELIQDMLIAPVSLGYFFVGRFFFAKTYYASSKCDNCGVCIKGCPVKAIKTVGGRPFWTFDCESCMHCMSYCPQKAIETAHGSIVLAVSVVSLLISDKFFEYFNRYIFDASFPPLRFTIESALFILFLGLWYGISHFMLRYKWYERLMVLTSLTSYKFWGRRYKSIRKY